VIDSAQNAATPQAMTHLARQKPVFRMMTSDRMAGSVPAWVQPDSAQAATLCHIETAAGTTGSRSFDDVLSDATSSYAPQQATPHTLADEPFGFGDVVDIVNPLHHIPLVGMLYRSLSGDQIRPSSQIIGGAVFGGAMGAASGIANVIMTEETGKDIAGNVLAVISPSDHPADLPVQRLAAANQAMENPDQQALQSLPGSALSFAALDHKPLPAAQKQVWKFND
jgi:hypothetical protein